MHIITFVFLIYLAVACLIAFALYAIDKAKARRGAWRISEKALLLSGFLGGAVGALLAMQLVRHKTKHPYFYLVNILGVLWQGGLLVYLLFFL